MKRIGICAAVTLAIVAIAGCGSSSSSPSGSQAASGASGKGAIMITIIGGFSSSVPAELDPEAAAGAKARVAAINAAGGINGRKVQLVVCDDHVNVNSAGDCARNAVADGSVALVGTLGFENTQTYPVIRAAGMVSIGAFPISPAIGNSPNAVCFTGGGTAELAALPVLLHQRGAAQISALVPGGLGPATTGLEQTFTQGVKASGARMGTIAEFPLTSAQFDAPVAKALSSGTDGVVAFAPGPAQGPLIVSIESANSKVKVAVPAAAMSPSVIKFLGAHGDGILVGGAGEPATSSAAGIQMFNQDMDKYAPSAAKDDLSIDAWASVWLFERLAQSASSITRANILHAAKSLTNYELGGIYGPLTTSAAFTGFPGMKCLANNTVVAEVLRGGQFSPLGRLPAFKGS